MFNKSINIAVVILVLLLIPAVSWGTNIDIDSMNVAKYRCKVAKDKYLAECLTEPKSPLLRTDTVTSRWVGTAPVCGASAGSCGSLHYWFKNNYGDGAACTIGSKVLCVSQPMNSFRTTFWVGIAPFCEASPKDCALKDSEFIAYGTAGDGQACAYGKKVLCARR